MYVQYVRLYVCMYICMYVCNVYNALIAKIAAFGVRRTHMWLSKNKCIHNVSLFGVDFWLEASLDLFENEAGQAVTVTGVRYRNMITQFFLPKLDDIDVANMWFQQDRVPHGIQLVKQFIYCMRRFQVVYSLV